MDCHASSRIGVAPRYIRRTSECNAAWTTRRFSKTIWSLHFSDSSATRTRLGQLATHPGVSLRASTSGQGRSDGCKRSRWRHGGDGWTNVDVRPVRLVVEPGCAEAYRTGRHQDQGVAG